MIKTKSAVREWRVKREFLAMTMKILIRSMALVLGTTVPLLADTAPAPGIFDELPAPNHLRQVENPDEFLNYQTRTFIQVATFRGKQSAQLVMNSLKARGLEPSLYLYQSYGRGHYVVMVAVGSKQVMRDTLREVRSLGYADAFARNYRVPRQN